MCGRGVITRSPGKNLWGSSKEAVVTDNHTVRSGQDLITGLIEQLGAEQTRDRAARELVPAVHAAVYPMCLQMLGNRDDAYDVEHDTVLRLLNRVNSPNTAHEPIIQGKAYVRQIARNLCIDRLRDTGRAVSLDDLSEGDLPVAADADPDSAVTSLAVTRTLTDKTLPARYDKALSAAFGYTSKQLLGDFAGLSDLGLKVVMLRQLGLADKEIAQRLGAGLTTGAVHNKACGR
jgi:DNA-directed RNA polymerase specialized sigma24 family protein